MIMPKLELKSKRLMGVCLFFTAMVVAYHMGQSNRLADDKVDLIGQAEAADGVVKDRTAVAPDRYVYYPGTEKLARREIRMTACGTFPTRSSTGCGNWEPRFRTLPAKST